MDEGIIPGGQDMADGKQVTGHILGTQVYDTLFHLLLIIFLLAIGFVGFGGFIGWLGLFGLLWLFHLLGIFDLFGLFCWGGGGLSDFGH